MRIVCVGDTFGRLSYLRMVGNGDCYKKAKDAKDETAKKRFTSIYEALKKEFAEGSR